MLEILAALSGTRVPEALVGLGALMLVLSLMERRVAATLGGLILLLGFGISLAPTHAPDRSLSSGTSPSPAETVLRRSEIRSPADTASATGPARGRTRGDSESAALGSAGPGGAAGCTAKFTDLEMDLAAVSEGAATSVGSEEVLYGGFLANLMPSVELLPCGTRHYSSRPLSSHAVAANGGRPEADALRVLLDGGFAGLERIYGSECSRSLRKDEVPLARIRVLRFDSVGAAMNWETLRLRTAANERQVAEAAKSRTAWLQRPCGPAAPAAVLRQEKRTGNIIIVITLYAALENLGDHLLENYSRLIINDIVGRIYRDSEGDVRNRE